MSMNSDHDWRDDAACLTVPPETMTPEVATPEEVEAALALCVGCPVRVECRALAESEPAAHGVFGGEWWGLPPRDPSVSACQWCGGDATAGAVYCGGRCRIAAWRARTGQVCA